MDNAAARAEVVVRIDKEMLHCPLCTLSLKPPIFQVCSTTSFSSTNLAFSKSIAHSCITVEMEKKTESFCSTGSGTWPTAAPRPAPHQPVPLLQWRQHRLKMYGYRASVAYSKAYGCRASIAYN
jgi:hypothetical protein